MGKVNRSGMPQNKSASIRSAMSEGEMAQHLLDQAEKRKARGMTGFTRKQREKDVKTARNKGVQKRAAKGAGESRLGQGARGGQY